MDGITFITILFSCICMAFLVPFIIVLVLFARAPEIDFKE